MVPSPETPWPYAWDRSQEDTSKFHWGPLSRSIWKRSGECDYLQSASIWFWHRQGPSDVPLSILSGSPPSPCHCTDQLCMSSNWHHKGSTWPALPPAWGIPLLQRYRMPQGTITHPPKCNWEWRVDLTHERWGLADSLSPLSLQMYSTVIVS